MREAHDDLLVLEEGQCTEMMNSCCTASLAKIK